MSKVEATIRNIGDKMGWEGDNNTVGPLAAAAKQSFLRLIPHIMPLDSDHKNLYRLVLDHLDFGSHSMSISMDEKAQPLVPSPYDWEVTGCVMSTILSDPLITVIVDLLTDENASSSIIRVCKELTRATRVIYQAMRPRAVHRGTA